MVNEPSVFELLRFDCNKQISMYPKIFEPLKIDRLSLHRWMSLFVMRFYGPVNPVGLCRARSVYLNTRLLGRLSPLSG